MSEDNKSSLEISLISYLGSQIICEDNVIKGLLTIMKTELMTKHSVRNLGDSIWKELVACTCFELITNAFDQ